MAKTILGEGNQLSDGVDSSTSADVISNAAQRIALSTSLLLGSFAQQVSAQEVQVAMQGDEAFRVAMVTSENQAISGISVENINSAFTNFLRDISYIPDAYRGELSERFQADFDSEAQQRIILMHQSIIPLTNDAEGGFVRELRVPSVVRDRILSHVGESHATNSRTYKGVELALQKFSEFTYPGDTWENLLLEHGGPEVQNIPVFYAVEVTAAERMAAEQDRAAAEQDRAAAEQDRAAAEAARDALREAVNAANGS